MGIVTAFYYIHTNRKTDEPRITLYLSASNSTVQMNLEEYIIGTVAAEMPASFGIEALKAQAVCARTYAVRKIIENRSYPKGANLSDDINTCQAYISAQAFQTRNPQAYQELWEKIKRAVTETRGQVMMYDGEPIDALYHSTCGGKTESAEASGRNIPYLKSVECNFCKDSKHYQTTEEVSAQVIKERLTLKAPLQIKITERTSSGRVSHLEVNGSALYAETFRSALNLPSTWWSFRKENGNLIITSRGYGHGLGLCQYGAGGMAASGYDYQNILHHYYQGIILSRLDY